MYLFEKTPTRISLTDKLSVTGLLAVSISCLLSMLFSLGEAELTGLTRDAFLSFSLAVPALSIAAAGLFRLSELAPRISVLILVVPSIVGGVATAYGIFVLVLETDPGAGYVFGTGGIMFIGTYMIGTILLTDPKQG